MKANIYESFPAELLDCNVTEIKKYLSAPSLFHLKGERDDALFISTLLHANETTGFYGLQKLLKTFLHDNKPLPRDLIIFIGNVFAVEEGVRMLPGQADYNRVWADGDTVEHKLADHIKALMQKEKLFACIDIHNNTGINPHYSCVNSVEKAHVNLASYFGPTIIYFLEPHEVLSNAFAKFCPSVTVECGLSGTYQGIEHVCDFLNTVLHLPSLDEGFYRPEDLNFFHSHLRIKVPRDATIVFGKENQSADFCFVEHFDHLNFNELKKDEVIGWRFNDAHKLMLINEHDQDVADELIQYNGNEISFNRNIIPSMLTKDVNAIHQDCLGYLMDEMVGA